MASRLAKAEADYKRLPGFWKVSLGAVCSCGCALSPDYEGFSLVGNHFHVLRECRRCDKKWTLILEIKGRRK